MICLQCYTVSIGKSLFVLFKTLVIIYDLTHHNVPEDMSSITPHRNFRSDMMSLFCVYQKYSCVILWWTLTPTSTGLWVTREQKHPFTTLRPSQEKQLISGISKHDWSQYWYFSVNVVPVWVVSLCLFTTFPVESNLSLMLLINLLKTCVLVWMHVGKHP